MQTRIRRRMVLVTCHLFLSFTLSAFSQNLFKNPSFEEPAITGQFEVTAIPGWIVTGAAAGEIQRGVDGVIAAHGQQWLELDATVNTAVSQDVPTVIGQRYRIQPWVANRQGSPSSTVEVLVDGNSLGTIVNTTTTFSTAFAEFVATKLVHRVTFAAVGPQDTLGDYLDNVLMVPVDAAQSLIGYRYYIPHIAQGGIWRTIIDLTNAGTLGATASHSYSVEEVSPGGIPTFVDSSSLGANRAKTIPLTGTATLRVGWVRVQSAAPLRVSAIFTSSSPGRPDFEAGVPAREPTTELFAPFTNIAPYQTGTALINPNPYTINLQITLRDQNGTLIEGKTLVLAAFNHRSFYLPQEFAASTGRSGSVEIRGLKVDGTPASFVPLGLRLTNAGAFASLPW